MISGLTTGGAEKALYNLLKGGLEASHRNHVISLGGIGEIGSDILQLGIPVTALNIRGTLPSISSLIKLRQVVRKVKPDIIQGWMYHGNLAATLARTMARYRPMLAWNIHYSLYDLSYEKPMTRNVIRANHYFSSTPDALLYVSQRSRKLHETFGFSSQKALVIHNGFDVQQFSFTPKSHQRIRTALGIPDNACVIGHVARLHPMKDHSMFLRAAVTIALRYPDTHYLLCGKDVTLHNESLRQIIPTEVLSRFHLLGERSDVADLMSAMDIFCLSSAWGEAFPIVLGEAMSNMVPCVATDVGDSALIIDDTGMIVSPGDEDAFILGIERLITMPLKKRQAMGFNARARIEACFSLGAIVEQYTALYEKLLKEKSVE